MRPAISSAALFDELDPWFTRLLECAHVCTNPAWTASGIAPGFVLTPNGGASPPIQPASREVNARTIMSLYTLVYQWANGQPLGVSGFTQLRTAAASASASLLSDALHPDAIAAAAAALIGGGSPQANLPLKRATCAVAQSLLDAIPEAHRFELGAGAVAPLCAALLSVSDDPKCTGDALVPILCLALRLPPPVRDVALRLALWSHTTFPPNRDAAAGGGTTCFVGSDTTRALAFSVAADDGFGNPTDDAVAFAATINEGAAIGLFLRLLHIVLSIVDTASDAELAATAATANARRSAASRLAARPSAAASVGDRSSPTRRAAASIPASSPLSASIATDTRIMRDASGRLRMRLGGGTQPSSVLSSRLPLPPTAAASLPRPPPPASMVGAGLGSLRLAQPREGTNASAAGAEASPSTGAARLTARIFLVSYFHHRFCHIEGQLRRHVSATLRLARVAFDDAIIAAAGNCPSVSRPSIRSRSSSSGLQQKTRGGYVESGDGPVRNPGPLEAGQDGDSTPRARRSGLPVASRGHSDEDLNLGDSIVFHSPDAVAQPDRSAPVQPLWRRAADVNELRAIVDRETRALHTDTPWARLRECLALYQRVATAMTLTAEARDAAVNAWFVEPYMHDATSYALGPLLRDRIGRCFFGDGATSSEVRVGLVLLRAHRYFEVNQLARRVLAHSYAQTATADAAAHADAGTATSSGPVNGDVGGTMPVPAVAGDMTTRVASMFDAAVFTPTWQSLVARAVAGFGAALRRDDWPAVYHWVALALEVSPSAPASAADTPSSDPTAAAAAATAAATNTKHPPVTLAAALLQRLTDILVIHLEQHVLRGLFISWTAVSFSPTIVGFEAALCAFATRVVIDVADAVTKWELVLHGALHGEVTFARAIRATFVHALSLGVKQMSESDASTTIALNSPLLSPASATSSSSPIPVLRLQLPNFHRAPPAASGQPMSQSMGATVKFEELLAAALDVDMRGALLEVASRAGADATSLDRSANRLEVLSSATWTSSDAGRRLDVIMQLCGGAESSGTTSEWNPLGGMEIDRSSGAAGPFSFTASSGLSVLRYIFALVRERDIFMDRYQPRLARRLLAVAVGRASGGKPQGDKGVASLHEAEMQVLQQLRAACDVTFTRKCEGMLQDMATARVGALRFQDYAETLRRLAVGEDAEKAAAALQANTIIVKSPTERAHHDETGEPPLTRASSSTLFRPPPHPLTTQSPQHGTVASGSPLMRPVSPHLRERSFNMSRTLSGAAAAVAAAGAAAVRRASVTSSSSLQHLVASVSGAAALTAAAARAHIREMSSGGPWHETEAAAAAETHASSSSDYLASLPTWAFSPQVITAAYWPPLLPATAAAAPPAHDPTHAIRLSAPTHCGGFGPMVDLFTRYYTRRYPARVLVWLPDLCACSVELAPPNGRAPAIVSCGFWQAMFLLSVDAETERIYGSREAPPLPSDNHPLGEEAAAVNGERSDTINSGASANREPIQPRRTIAQVAVDIGASNVAEIRPHVASMVLAPGCNILRRVAASFTHTGTQASSSPAGALMAPRLQDSDAVELNPDFVPRQRRVWLPQVAPAHVRPAATGAASDMMMSSESASMLRSGSGAVSLASPSIVGGGAAATTTMTTDLGRAHAIDAAIVRILKARGSLRIAELFVLVVAQCARRFTPQPRQMKERVDHLLAQEYIRRDESDPETLAFVA